MLEKKETLKKFSGGVSLVQKLGEEKIQQWSGEFLVLLKSTIEKEATHVEEYVNHLRELNEGIDRDSLSKKIISRRSWKAGGIGAVCGLGGLITLPVTMPSDMYLTFRIQARMVLAIAYIYGWNIHDE